jgi:predicted Zn-ribbon and HTH transcriptional regulator
MSRPPLEVADLIRGAGHNFIQGSRRWITGQHLKVLAALERCRTAALGGHRDECSRCGYRAISYNSCRNRHCPKCQAQARDRWLEARRQELLPTRYVHVVFTLPHLLAPLALQNKRLVYNLLMRTSAQTLLEIARDPQHLGAEIGFFSVLHTWNQKLEHHPHVHCVVAAGGLSLDHRRWRASRRRFFLPLPVLARVFRGKFVAALKQAFLQGQLSFHGLLKPLASPKAFAAFLRPLFRQDWIVYCKPPFGGPEYVLHYLGAYTHRVAISNHRLVALAGDQVTFRWRDSAHGNQQRLMTLSVEEFLRRFLLHVLPAGFVRIRHFGFLASRHRARLLPLCFQLLGSAKGSTPSAALASAHGEASASLLPTSSWTCPQCGGLMIILERLSAAQITLRSPPLSLGQAS